MIQIENIKALCSGATARREAVVYLSVTPDIGFLSQFFPCLIISRQIQNRVSNQNNPISVSAGNVLTVTTMRPDDFNGWNRVVEC